MKLQFQFAILAVLLLTVKSQDEICLQNDYFDGLDQEDVLTFITNDQSDNEFEHDIDGPQHGVILDCFCQYVNDNEGDFTDDLAIEKTEVCAKCTTQAFCTASTNPGAVASVDDLVYTACGTGPTAGYTIGTSTVCIPQKSFNKCYSYMGDLEASVNAQAVPQYGDITTDCGTSTVTKTLNNVADTSAIELVIDYADWSLFEWKGFDADGVSISDCSFDRSLHSSSNCLFGSEQTGCKDITNPADWGTSVQTVEQDFTVDTNLQPWTVYMDESESKGRLYLPVADIIDENNNYCREMKLGDEVQSNSENFYYQCYFAEQVTIWGQAQLVYTFYVQLEVNRQTSATESLQVKKTLVEGQCCKNSLGVESHLWFCDADKNGKDGGACTKAQTLTEVPRLTDFYIRWELNEASTAQPGTATLKPLVSLYPDTVSIGPFIADFSIDNNWEGVTVGGVSLIKLKSNVAFVAEITVNGKIYNIIDNQPGPYNGSDDTRPHTCFPVNGVPPTAPAANCAVTSAGTTVRRLLAATSDQLKDMGTPKSQVQVSAPLQIKDENNQNTNNKTKKSDDDNTVLIAVLVSLAVVLIIGGVIGGIYYCKSKKSNQAKYENSNVKQII